MGERRVYEFFAARQMGDSELTIISGGRWPDDYERLVPAADLARAEAALREIEPECRAFADYAAALIPGLVGQARLQWQEREQQFRRLADVARAALNREGRE